MSPKAAPTEPTHKGRTKSKPASITTLTTGIPVVVDGIKFTMQLDDAAMLYEVIETARLMREFDSSQVESDVAVALLEMGRSAKRAIDLALGDGAHALLFGEGRLPIIRSSIVLQSLDTIAGPAYSKLLATIKKG